MTTVKEHIAAIYAKCAGVWAQSGVTSWERARLEEWKDRTILSEKQEAIIAQIERKVFGENGK